MKSVLVQNNVITRLKEILVGSYFPLHALKAENAKPEGSLVLQSQL
jgi:hypothetical protein